MGAYFATLTPEATFHHYGSGVEDASIFRGYQLYYKFYAVGAAVASSLDEFSQLAAGGFTRVYMSEDSEDGSPAMSSIRNVLVEPKVTDRKTNFSVTISFQYSDSHPEPTLTVFSTDASFTSAGTVELRRYVTYTDSALHMGECKSFHDLVSGDADIAALYTSYLELGKIQIAFYAVAYGIQDLTTAVSSDPVYLGVIEWD